MKYYSTKTYGNDRGWSCCFRQWRATHSHCSLLHGYAIGIKLIFEADTLDDKNWVQDFGGLGEFKKWAEQMFDHTLVVAEDDPQLELFHFMAERKLCDLRIVKAVGCEKFAEMCFHEMNSLLPISKPGTSEYSARVRLKSVEVFEHPANSAIYEG